MDEIAPAGALIVAMALAWFPGARGGILFNGR